MAASVGGLIHFKPSKRCRLMARAGHLGVACRSLHGAKRTSSKRPGRSGFDPKADVLPAEPTDVRTAPRPHTTRPWLRAIWGRQSATCGLPSAPLLVSIRDRRRDPVHECPREETSVARPAIS